MHGPKVVSTNQLLGAHDHVVGIGRAPFDLEVTGYTRARNRKTGSPSGGLYAGKRPRALKNCVYVSDVLLWIGIASGRRPNSEREHMIGVEPLIYVHQPHKAAQQQPRSRKQRKRKRDFSDDQSVAYPVRHRPSR